MVYHYNVTVTDKVGFKNTTKTRKQTLDNTPPRLLFLNAYSNNSKYFFEADTDMSLPDNIYINTNHPQKIFLNLSFSELYPFEYTGSSAYDSSPSINVENQTVGLIKYSLDENSESETITLTVRDLAGNENSTQIIFNRDTEPININLKHPQQNATKGWLIDIIAEPSDSLSGVDYINYNVTHKKILLANGSLVENEAQWNSSELIEANVTLNLKGVDNVRNLVYQRINFTIDNKNPDITIIDPFEEFKNDSFELDIRVHNTHLSHSSYNISNGTLIYGNDMMIGSSDFIWSDFINISDMMDENYTINCFAKDVINNSKKSKSWFMLDTISPNLFDIAINDSDYIMQSTDLFNLTVGSTDKNGVTTVKVKRGDYEVGLKQQNLTHWTSNLRPEDLQCPQGDCLLTIVSTDVAGNSNRSDLIINVDDIPPEIIFNVNDSNNPVKSSTLLKFSANLSDANDLKEVSMNGTPLDNVNMYDYYTINSTSDFGCDRTGNCTFFLTAIDVAGNRNNESLTVSVDNQAPKIIDMERSINRSMRREQSVQYTLYLTDVSEITRVTIGNSSSVLMEHIGTDEEIDIFEATTTADEDGLKCNISDGDCRIKVFAKDIAGNKNESFSFHITIDEVPPEVTIPILNEYTGISNDFIVRMYSNIDISVEIKDSNKIKKAIVGNNTRYNLSVLIDSQYSLEDLTPQDYGCQDSDGPCTLRIYAEDEATNVNTSRTSNFTIDSTPPRIWNLYSNETDNVSRSNKKLRFRVNASDIHLAQVRLNKTLMDKHDNYYFLDLAPIDLGCKTDSYCSLSANASDLVNWSNETRYELVIDDSKPLLSNLSCSEPDEGPEMMPILYPEQNVTFDVYAYDEMSYIDSVKMFEAESSSFIMEKHGGTYRKSTSPLNLGCTRGYYNITFVAYDAADNWNQVSLRVFIDDDTPIIETFKPDNSTTLSTPNIDEYADPNGTITFEMVINDSGFIKNSTIQIVESTGQYDEAILPFECSSSGAANKTYCNVSFVPLQEFNTVNSTHYTFQAKVNDYAGHSASMNYTILITKGILTFNDVALINEPPYELNKDSIKLHVNVTGFPTSYLWINISADNSNEYHFAQFNYSTYKDTEQTLEYLENESNIELINFIFETIIHPNTTGYYSGYIKGRTKEGVSFNVTEDKVLFVTGESTAKLEVGLNDSLSFENITMDYHPSITRTFNLTNKGPINIYDAYIKTYGTDGIIPNDSSKVYCSNNHSNKLSVNESCLINLSYDLKPSAQTSELDTIARWQNADESLPGIAGTIFNIIIEPNPYMILINSSIISHNITYKTMSSEKLPIYNHGNFELKNITTRLFNGEFAEIKDSEIGTLRSNETKFLELNFTFDEIGSFNATYLVNATGSICSPEEQCTGYFDIDADVYDYLNVSIFGPTKSINRSSISQVEFICSVISAIDERRIGSHNVSLYTNNNFTAMNQTNTSGETHFTYNTDIKAGVHNITCHIYDHGYLRTKKGYDESQLTIIGDLNISVKANNESIYWYDGAEPYNKTFNASITDERGYGISNSTVLFYTDFDFNNVSLAGNCTTNSKGECSFTWNPDIQDYQGTMSFYMNATASHHNPSKTQTINVTIKGGSSITIVHPKSRQMIHYNESVILDADYLINGTKKDTSEMKVRKWYFDDLVILEGHEDGSWYVNVSNRSYSRGKHNISTYFEATTGDIFTDIRQIYLYDIVHLHNLSDYNFSIMRKSGEINLSAMVSQLFNKSFLNGYNCTWRLDTRNTTVTSSQNGICSYRFISNRSFAAGSHTINLSIRSDPSSYLFIDGYRNNYQIRFNLTDFLNVSIINNSLDTSKNVYFKQEIMHGQVNVTDSFEMNENDALVEWYISRKGSKQSYPNGYTIDERIPIDQGLGFYNLTVNVSKKNYIGTSQKFPLEIRGFAGIYMEDPGTESFKNNDLNISCRVKDLANDSGISKYPVRISLTNEANSLNITELTNSKGYVNFTINESTLSSLPVGKYNLSCRINDRQFYNASIASRHTEIELRDKLNLTLNTDTTRIFRDNSFVDSDTQIILTGNVTSSGELINNASVHFYLNGEAWVNITSEDGTFYRTYDPEFSKGDKAGNITIEAYATKDYYQESALADINTLLIVHTKPNWTDPQGQIIHDLRKELMLYGRVLESYPLTNINEQMDVDITHVKPYKLDIFKLKGDVIEKGSGVHSEIDVRSIGEGSESLDGTIEVNFRDVYTMELKLENKIPKVDQVIINLTKIHSNHSNLTVEITDKTKDFIKTIPCETGLYVFNHTLEGTEAFTLTFTPSDDDENIVVVNSISLKQSKYHKVFKVMNRTPFNPEGLTYSGNMEEIVLNDLRDDSGWYSSLSNGDTVSLEKNDTASEGNFSIKVTYPGTSTSLFGWNAETSVNLEEYETFEFSIFLNGSQNLQINFSDNHGNIDSNDLDHEDDQWNRYQFHLDNLSIDGQRFTGFKIRINGGEDDSEIYFDEFMLGKDVRTNTEGEFKIPFLPLETGTYRMRFSFEPDEQYILSQNASYGLFEIMKIGTDEGSGEQEAHVYEILDDEFEYIVLSPSQDYLQPLEIRNFLNKSLDLQVDNKCDGLTVGEGTGKITIIGSQKINVSYNSSQIKEGKCTIELSQEGSSNYHDIEFLFNKTYLDMNISSPLEPIDSFNSGDEIEILLDMDSDQFEVEDYEIAIDVGGSPCMIQDKQITEDVIITCILPSLENNPLINDIDISANLQSLSKPTQNIYFVGNITTKKEDIILFKDITPPHIFGPNIYEYCIWSNITDNDKVMYADLFIGAANESLDYSGFEGSNGFFDGNTNFSLDLSGDSLVLEGALFMNFSSPLKNLTIKIGNTSSSLGDFGEVSHIHTIRDYDNILLPDSPNPTIRVPAGSVIKSLALDVEGIGMDNSDSRLVSLAKIDEDFFLYDGENGLISQINKSGFVRFIAGDKGRIDLSGSSSMTKVDNSLLLSDIVRDRIHKIHLNGTISTIHLEPGAAPQKAYYAPEMLGGDYIVKDYLEEKLDVYHFNGTFAYSVLNQSVSDFTLSNSGIFAISEGKVVVLDKYNGSNHPVKEIYNLSKSYLQEPDLPWWNGSSLFIQDRESTNIHEFTYKENLEHKTRYEKAGKIDVSESYLISDEMLSIEGNKINRFNIFSPYGYKELQFLESIDNLVGKIFPQNIQLDIGKDSYKDIFGKIRLLEFSVPKLNYSVKVKADQRSINSLNEYLSSCTGDWNNGIQYCNIPIEVNNSKIGKIKLGEVNLSYGHPSMKIQISDLLNQNLFAENPDNLSAEGFRDPNRTRMNLQIYVENGTGHMDSKISYLSNPRFDTLDRNGTTYSKCVSIPDTKGYYPVGIRAHDNSSNLGISYSYIYKKNKLNLISPIFKGKESDNGQITLKSSDTNEILNRISFDAQNNLVNKSLYNMSYDLDTHLIFAVAEQKINSTVRVTVKKATFNSENETVERMIHFSRVDLFNSTQPPSTVSISDLGNSSLLGGISINNSLKEYENILIEFDYSNILDIFEYYGHDVNEKTLFIYECQFDNISRCSKKDWKKREDTFRDTRKNTVKINTTHTSTYVVAEDNSTIIDKKSEESQSSSKSTSPSEVDKNGMASSVPFCGDGICQSDENVSTCSIDCLPNLQISAQCGNGICELGENSDNCPNDCMVIPIDVEYDFSKLHLKPGTIKSYMMSIDNRINESMDLSVRFPERLTQFLNQTTYNLSLDSQEKQRLNLSFSIPPDTNPILETNAFEITYLEKVKRYPFTLVIEEYSSVPLRLNLELLKERYSFSDSFNFKVTIQDINVNVKENITLRYQVLDYESNEIIINITDSITPINQQFTIDLPVITNGSINHTENSYIFRVSTDIGSQKISDEAYFEVYKALWTPVLLRNLSMFAIFLGIGILVFISSKKYKKWKLSKMRYVLPDFDSLPKKSNDSLVLGKIPETNKKAFYHSSDLTTHALIAGSTGSGKSVTASVMVEQFLLANIPVLVFDPTCQWTGFVKRCQDKNILEKYQKFGLTEQDAQAFKGLIYNVKDPYLSLDIQKYMNPGEITVFNLNELKPGQYDLAVMQIIDSMFTIPWQESPELKMVLVFDEVHRLLEKYGGSGGYISLEKACREFRKWGIGIIMASQVSTDFKQAVAGNILTEVQLNTKSMDDINKIAQKYGTLYSSKISRQGIGVGMLQNPKYNEGKPWFIHFKPPLHDPHKISNEELKTYDEYSRKIDYYEGILDLAEEKGDSVKDLRLELKLAKDKLKSGQFKMVEIYLPNLIEKLEKIKNYSQLRKEFTKRTEKEEKKIKDRIKSIKKEVDDKLKKSAEIKQDDTTKDESSNEPVDNKDTAEKGDTAGNGSNEKK